MNTDTKTIYVIAYGRGGEIDRRAVESEQDIAAAISDMGPWAVGDTIKVVDEDQ